MFFVVRYDQGDKDASGRAMQRIINGECKGDHALTYEEALQEERERTKKIQVRL